MTNPIGGVASSAASTPPAVVRAVPAQITTKAVDSDGDNDGTAAAAAASSNAADKAFAAAVQSIATGSTVSVMA